MIFSEFPSLFQVFPSAPSLSNSSFIFLWGNYPLPVKNFVLSVRHDVPLKKILYIVPVSKISCSVAQLCLTLYNPMDCSTPGFPLPFTISWSLLKLMYIELMMSSNHLILCHSLLLPSIFPSIRVFSKELVLHISWPKYWSFSFSISPSSEYSGLITFRMDWFDLLAVQGTLKSFVQHHSSKASILQRSAFFIVQLSHPYMTTGKARGLTRWTFVSKVMSLLFNMLSRSVTLLI